MLLVTSFFLFFFLIYFSLLYYELAAGAMQGSMGRVGQLGSKEGYGGLAGSAWTFTASLLPLYTEFASALKVRDVFVGQPKQVWMLSFESLAA